MKKILSLYSIICLTACVSSSRHKEVEAELQETQKQLAISKAINSKLQKKLGKSNTSNTQLEVSVSEMQQALDELAKRKLEAEQRIAQFKTLTDKFKSLVSSGELKIKIVDGRMILALPSDVLFESASAKLSEKGHSTVVKTANILSAIQDKKYQIEGHTDNVPIHSSKYPSNWELASARSITVLKTMVEAGLASDRISAASFAETRPILSNNSDEDRKLNRRIEIAIVPDLSGLPGYEELNKISEE